MLVPMQDTHNIQFLIFIFEWQTVKVKAEARLDLLKQAGVTVETWLKSAMNQVMEELENERWNNLSTHDPSLSVRPTQKIETQLLKSVVAFVKSQGNKCPDVV